MKIHRQVTLLVLAMLSFACGERPQAASVERDVGAMRFALDLPDGLSVGTISYSLYGPSYSHYGDIAADAATFSASIDDIPIGSGYMLTLTASESDGGGQCYGMAELNIVRHETVMVSVRLSCAGKKVTGSVSVHGEVNICAVVAAAMATRSTDGKTVELQGLGSDADNGPSALAYTWSTSAGMLTDADQASATLTCPSEARDVTVGLQVNDGDCGDQAQLVVHCTVVAPNC